MADKVLADGKTLIDLGGGVFAEKVVAVAGDGSAIGVVTPVAQGALTNRSGTITAGGTAQVLAAANTARRYLMIQNASVGTLWVSLDTTAVAGSPSIALEGCNVANDGSGGSLVFEGSFIPTGAISIIGATTGQAFVGKEG